MMGDEGDSAGGGFRLDVVVSASGFGRKNMKVLEEVSCHPDSCKMVR